MVLICVFAFYQVISYLLYVTEFSKHVDPNAVAGYFHCQVDEAQVANFDNNYACDFSPRPNPSDVIIVTFINSAWVSLSKNWICSAEKAGLKDKLFLVGFEPNVCAQLPGVACYEHPGVSISGTSFGKPGYQKLMIERTKIILKLLSCGQKIALVDADITFLKDPFEYLDDLMMDKDIVFQSDSSGVKVLDSVLAYFFRYICGGFIYMKSSEPIKRLWLSVLQYQNKFKWNDQAGLNVCIRHHTHNIRWNVLDPEHFPNGRQYFFYNQTSDKNLIVHANHLMGQDKLVRMIAADLWCETQQGKFICKSAPNFERHCLPADITNKHPDPESVAIEEAVKNAVNHNGIRESRAYADIVHDSSNNGAKDPTKVRRRNYDPKLAPEWCERFIRVCRTKFGVEVL